MGEGLRHAREHIALFYNLHWVYLMILQDTQPRDQQGRKLESNGLDKRNIALPYLVVRAPLTGSSSKCCAYCWHRKREVAMEKRCPRTKFAGCHMERRYCAPTWVGQNQRSNTKSRSDSMNIVELCMALVLAPFSEL